MIITRELAYIGTLIPKPWVDPRWGKKGGPEEHPWSVREDDEWRFNGYWKTLCFPLEWCNAILNRESVFTDRTLQVRHVVQGDPKQGFHLLFPMYRYKGEYFPDIESATLAREKDNA